MQAWHLPRDQIVIVTMGPLMLKSIILRQGRLASSVHRVMLSASTWLPG
jgi:hypothetical protein